MMDTGHTLLSVVFPKQKSPWGKSPKDEHQRCRGTTLVRRPLAETAFESADTPLRCDVRTRRDLRRNSGRPRDSETMFSRPFRASFHRPRLSAAYLPGYSSLHRLWVIYFDCCSVYTIAGKLSTGKSHTERRKTAPSFVRLCRHTAGKASGTGIFSGKSPVSDCNPWAKLVS